MLVDGGGGVLSGGANVDALLRLGTLNFLLRRDLGLGSPALGLLLGGPLGGGLLLGLLGDDRALDRRGARVDGDPFLGALQPCLRGLSTSLFGFGVGNGLLAVGVLALASRGLLELALCRQRIVAGHGTGDFLGLALDRIDQTLAGLVGHVVLTQLKLPLTLKRSPIG